MKNILWENRTLNLLDQTKLPTQEIYLHCTDWREVAEAIKMLRVRGAPAIGVAAAYGLILAASEANQKGETKSHKLKLFFEYAQILQDTRPTAINLAWSIHRVVSRVKDLEDSSTFEDLIDVIEKEAYCIEREDKALNDAISNVGLEELGKKNKKLRILTHCNAGALATAGVGTALGVIRALHEQGLIEMVYADETRPLLQGARLTAFELSKDHIPVTLISDNMAAYVMQQGLIDAVIVGADRITKNGDVANKIGTYGVAVLAHAHNIPFYVAAPYSTFDFTLETGLQIPIEMRHADEIRTIQGVSIAPSEVEVLNPAFDVTPHGYITGIITEAGLLQPPFHQSILRLQQTVEE